MSGLSLSALIIRFLLGGAAVLVSTIIARKMGDRAGGIFAAFPAVYLAALLTGRFDFSGHDLVTHSILLSKGAIFGMAINIFVAILAGYLLPRQGWKKGLLEAMVCWFVISMVVVMVTAN
ncbi:MAG: DUF3147 family protein [Bacillota bacterium]|nr:DUF3147 family protein [Bacillota bacterium]MDP4171793.1 DUF3147 family protein [Bacillota bacterium]